MSEADKDDGPVGKFFSAVMEELKGEADGGHGSEGTFDDARSMLDSVSQSLGTSNFRKAIMDAAVEKKESE
ncbi:hypothetical protein [Bombella mellum]|uniref:Uncharacterized protein n=1 Tax=Bombella mellum TaxID=2039288 RepID=A0ABR5ZRT8_9PROT|nr:hypothetical protein [Bombella mellum]MBA5726960.1 hypothetical protein [Bombella mellum]